MAYTLADIRQRILNDKLTDPTYDVTALNNFINDTQRQLFNTYELPFQENIFAGQLPAGGYIFTFPSDYQQTQSLVLTGPSGYVRDLTDLYVPYRQFNTSFPTPSSYTAGSPTVWTIYAGKLMFNRPTDQAYNLSLFYLKTPTVLAADTDVPALPQEFVELLVLGGYYRALERNEDFDLASFIKQNEYQEQVDLLVARYGKRQTGKPTTMGQPRAGAMGRARRARS